MKKAVAVILIFVTVILGIAPAQAKAEVKPWPKGPEGVSAAGAVVMDLKSGMVLYNKNMNTKRYPASITKIMTTLLGIENSSLSETVTYKDTDVLNLESGASNAGIQVGEKLTMEQSLYCVMIQSANEACNGVASHISGSVSNFVKAMNAKAAAIGCKNTHFNNPNGLWMKNHYTTPYDMALITREAMKNPEFRKICGTKRYDVQPTNKTKEVRNLANHHEMIFPDSYPQYGYDYCIGGKTGYTFKCQATLVTCAKKGDMELVCVVMKTKSGAQGEPNVYTDTIKLLNYCFEKYSQYSLNDTSNNAVKEEDLFTNFSPFFDSQDNAGIKLDGNGSVFLPKGVSLDQATKKVDFYDAPVQKSTGKIIGRVSYSYNNQDAGGADIIYGEPKPTVLRDSIDMKEWVEDAVEEANKPAFPIKTVLILLLLAAIIAAGGTFGIFRVQVYREKTRGSKHYKRVRKTKDFFLKKK
jgi:D-alanyl-D-alanine carboxypeptidase